MQPLSAPCALAQCAKTTSPPCCCASCDVRDLALCAQALRAFVLCLRVRSAWAGIGPGASRRRAAAARTWTMKSPNFPSLRKCRSSSSSPIACDTCAQKGTHCGDLQNGMRCTCMLDVCNHCVSDLQYPSRIHNSVGDCLDHLFTRGRDRVEATVPHMAPPM